MNSWRVVGMTVEDRRCTRYFHNLDSKLEALAAATDAGLVSVEILHRIDRDTGRFLDEDEASKLREELKRVKLDLALEQAGAGCLRRALEAYGDLLKLVQETTPGSSTAPYFRAERYFQELRGIALDTDAGKGVKAPMTTQVVIEEFHRVLEQQ